MQNAISEELNRPYLGSAVEILVEGPSKSSRKHPEEGPAVQLAGRTVHDQIVVFDGPRDLIGKIVAIEIVKTDAFTLFGQIAKR